MGVSPEGHVVDGSHEGGTSTKREWDAMVEGKDDNGGERSDVSIQVKRTPPKRRTGGRSRRPV